MPIDGVRHCLARTVCFTRRREGGEVRKETRTRGADWKTKPEMFGAHAVRLVACNCFSLWWTLFVYFLLFVILSALGALGVINVILCDLRVSLCTKLMCRACNAFSFLAGWLFVVAFFSFRSRFCRSSSMSAVLVFSVANSAGKCFSRSGIIIAAIKCASFVAPPSHICKLNRVDENELCITEIQLNMSKFVWFFAFEAICSNGFDDSDVDDMIQFTNIKNFHAKLSGKFEWILLIRLDKQKRARERDW